MTRYIAPYEGPLPTSAAGGGKPLPDMRPLSMRLGEHAAVAIGVGILVAVPAVWLSWSLALMAGATVGMLMFGARTAGLASGVRLSVALLRAHARVDELQRDIDALLAELDQADALHASALRDMQMARAEAAQLRSQVQPNYRSAASLYAPVRADARRLMEMYAERGQWTGRDVLMGRLRWTKGRYEAAFNLLRDAGVITVHHRTVMVQLGMEDALEAIDRYSQNTGAVLDGAGMLVSD